MKFLIFMGLVAIVSAGIPIPNREVGFVYQSGSPRAPVKLDLYIDQICPDSKNAFPTILRVADYYGPTKLRLRTRLFSLSYFRNGFYAAKGTHIVNKESNQTLTYAWIQKVYANYDSLTNAATMGQSDNQIIEKLADIAASVGVPKSTFLARYQESEFERAARIEWKYGATRRVAATPTFMVNDVVVAGTPSWSVSDWRNIIDPLLGLTEHSTSFPVGSGNLVHPTRWAVAVSSLVMVFIMAAT